MTTIVRSIDVNVPVRTAYNQGIRFDEFPKFMEDLKQVTQMDAKRLDWNAEIAGQEMSGWPRSSSKHRTSALPGRVEMVSSMRPW